MTEVDKQERTNRDTGLENIIESMYTEDCGIVHASAKRKKKKVKEEDDPKDVVKEGPHPNDGSPLRAEVDAFFRMVGNTRTANEVHEAVLDIIDKHSGAGGAGAAVPTDPTGSPPIQRFYGKQNMEPGM